MSESTLMNENRTCHCPVCHAESELCRFLSDHVALARFQTLTAVSSALAAFATPMELVTHLHDRSSTEKHIRSADEILGALLRSQNSQQYSDLVPAILTVAFVPALHRVSREISVWFPSLARDDISQQVLTIFLELPASHAIRTRNGYFSLAIARELRRSAYRWAIRESRKSLPADEGEEAEHAKSYPVADGHFESSVLLQEFFSRCEESGILSTSDIEFLTKLKLEGYEAKEILGMNGANTAKAVHNRYQRILKRLREKVCTRKMSRPDTPLAQSSSTHDEN
jgi:hypothetical protein